MGSFIDRTGQRYGRLTVVRRADERHPLAVLWLCVCDCGAETVVPATALLSGNTRSCGGHKQAPEIQKICPVCGEIFGRYATKNQQRKGRREDITDFAARIYCSQKCYFQTKASTQDSLLERFWSKVQKGQPDECWLWLGPTCVGYGNFGISKNGTTRSVRAHRFIWELENGPIPKGLLVCHRCDVRACANPAHLFLGTHHDNTQDMMQKGRYKGGPNQPNLKTDEPHV